MINPDPPQSIRKRKVWFAQPLVRIIGNGILREDDSALFSLFVLFVCFLVLFCFFPFGACVENHTYVSANGVGFALLLSGEENHLGLCLCEAKCNGFFLSLIHTDARHHVGTNVESKSGPC